jgi:hypothetical protein
LKEAKLKIDYMPHTGQKEVLDGIMKSKADVIVIVCSRGWGKTLFTNNSICIPPTVKYDHFQLCWIAPNYKIARAPIDDVLFGINENTGERFINDTCPTTGFKFFDYKKGDNEVHWWNGSKWFLRSADAPDSIVSKGYNLIVIDEGALISKDVFQKQILPIARKKNCKIVIITTPRGKNWVYHLYLEGQDSSKSRYVSFRQPWWKRPDYPPLLKDLMKDLPKHIRDQEFGAEFIDGGGGTFTNLDKIFVGERIEFPTENQEWRHKEWKSLKKNVGVLAVDLAKMVDYTVITVFTNDKKCIYYSRMNKVDYKTVLTKIRNVAEQFDWPEVIYDATGVGNAITDFLSTELNVTPFVFTNNSKNDIVNRLIVACEHSQIELPNILTIRNELEIFEFQMTKTGKISYNAPDGKHDDCVMSIAMANFFLEENGMKGEIGEIDSFLDVLNDTRTGRDMWDDEDD